MKWRDVFICKQSGHTDYCKGIKEFNRQCTKRRRLESPMGGTYLHQIKFPILKALYIVYDVSTSKNGISSCELSRKLELRQKTCWLFKKKVMEAMESGHNFPMIGKVEVEDTYVGGQDDKALGSNEGKKKIKVVGMRGFMRDHIISSVEVKTDYWSG